MVLGKLPVPGRPTNLDFGRSRAYYICSRCGGCLDFFSVEYHFPFLLSLSLWQMAQYRLEYCLKWSLSPKQPTYPTYPRRRPRNLSSTIAPFDQPRHFFRFGFFVTYQSSLTRGWSGGAMVLGKLPVPGRPINLDLSRARAYYICSWCGLFGLFFLSSIISLSGRRPDLD